MNITGYVGGFTSKRGVSWHYHIGHNWRRVEQWHGNIVRKTGGWKTGRDTYAPNPSIECFDAIKTCFEFDRDPDHDDCVIIPDRSQDVLVCWYKYDTFGWIASISRTPEGRYRKVITHNDLDCLGIHTYDTQADAEGSLHTSLLDKWVKLDV